jgi:hypothetical protein
MNAVWDRQEDWIVTPPYSGKACGIDECSKTMLAPGPGQAYTIQFEIETYYRCTQYFCDDETNSWRCSKPRQKLVNLAF